MSLQDLLAHPQFRVLQRVGTRAWDAYFTSPTTGHTCWGGGNTAEVALQRALQAATGEPVVFNNEDLF